MKVVMYHHLTNQNAAGMFPHALDFEKFKRQLDFFKKEYGFVSNTEWQNFVEFGQMPEKRGKVLLTFDDATKCHYQLAYPELRSRGLWGIFFASTSPLATSRPLNVHLVQRLCADVPIGSLLDETYNLLGRRAVTVESIDLEGLPSIDYDRHPVQDKYREFKNLLNSQISYDLQSDVILHLLSLFQINVNCSEIYASVTELQDMQENRMHVECHSEHHRLLSRLDNVDQISDLTAATSYLKSKKLLKNMGYCHPFGGRSSYNENTLKILKSLSYRYAFSVEEREVVEEDCCENMYTLPRFDCNSFAPF